MGKAMKAVAEKKSAMKTVMKDGTLKKGALKKGNGDAAASSSKGKAMKKESPKGKNTKSTLDKGKLESLGHLTLQERVDRISEEVETPEAAALRLRDQMSKGDKSLVWSQHQTYLKGRPEEKKEYEQMSNAEKGRAQALWFVKKSSPKFIFFEQSLSGGDKVTKGDTWKSEKQMVDVFGREEFDRHVSSGRLLWREDPLTKGVWQYKDQGDIKREITVDRSKTLRKQQERVPDENEEDQFQQLWDADITSMLSDASIWGGSSLGKGKGGGKSLTIYDHKGKGRGKGGSAQLALGDEDKSEEVSLEEAQGKCRKMRDLCAKTASDLEICISQVRKTKFWSKAAQKDADQLQNDLHDLSGLLKVTLLKKSDDVDKLKEVCLEAAEKVKCALAQMKEYKGLVNKTSSKAGSVK
jgi:hypothetical protein